MAVRGDFSWPSLGNCGVRPGEFRWPPVGSSRWPLTDTQFGRVRLGRLYDIAFQPTGSDHPYRLCVVPTDHLSLPAADIWTNLLLVLRGDPERFFRVANWQRGRGQWQAGPVPVLPERQQVAGQLC